MRTIFTNLLVGINSLKRVFKDLFTTHFLKEKETQLVQNQTEYRPVKDLMMCDPYLEMFVQLVHQAGEKLVSILLLSDIQLLVPHLKDLQTVHISMNINKNPPNSPKLNLQLQFFTFQKFSGT